MPDRTPPPHRFVYVIGPVEGLQKVGIATDPKARLAALQTACPFDLVLHVAVPVPFAEAYTIERRAHRALSRRCARNEWFSVTPAEAVAAVREAADPRPAQSVPPPAEWRPRPLPDLEGLPLFGLRPEPAGGSVRVAPRRPLLEVCRAVMRRL
jgi:hypothetical protein